MTVTQVFCSYSLSANASYRYCEYFHLQDEILVLVFDNHKLSAFGRADTRMACNSVSKLVYSKRCIWGRCLEKSRVQGFGRDTVMGSWFYLSVSKISCEGLR